MNIITVALICAAVFAVCFLIDKGFTKLFRNQAQHHSGKAIRLSKRYGAMGLIIGVLGIASVITGLTEGTLLLVCGGILIVGGAALVIYYMTFGVFYDDDSFILTTFGKKSATYRYKDIKCQQLYNTYGSIIIELQMTDGRAFQLQSHLDGVYAFMDTAFAGWCKQQGKNAEDCPFYDPDNSCWFPTEEE